MQLPEEALFGFEEADALLTLVKNSVSEGLVQISSIEEYKDCSY